MDEPPILTATICADPDCDKQAIVRSLCETHYQRDYRNRRQANSGRPLRGDPVDSIQIGDDTFVACPDTLLPLAAQAADLDARAIIRIIWSHLLEAHLAGLEPFTITRTEP